MVEALEEGPPYWANDMSAREATAQTVGSALKHKPDVKAFYVLLLDSFKVLFPGAVS